MGSHPISLTMKVEMSMRFIMLRTKVYINEKQIDDICIINTGKKQKGETLYKVKAVPCDYYIWHRRKDGWETLLMKALEVKSKLELPSFINAISDMQKVICNE